MRALILALVILSVGPAVAETIRAPSMDALGCRTREYLDSIHGADDRGQAADRILIGLRSGECRRLADGLRVVVDARSYPYVCAREAGSSDRCYWVEIREVRP